jgi:hypothetical protein
MGYWRKKNGDEKKAMTKGKEWEDLESLFTF